MLLAIDIGNTNTVLGVFDGDKLETSWRIKTDARSTLLHDFVPAQDEMNQSGDRNAIRSGRNPLPTPSAIAPSRRRPPAHGGGGRSRPAPLPGQRTRRGRRDDLGMIPAQPRGFG